MSMINEYELLKEISYVRTGGSKQERECALFLKEQIEKMGLEAHLEDFDVQGSVIKKASLKVVTPFEKEIVCKPYFCSGNAERLRGEIVFLRDPNSQMELSAVKDKIVIIQGYLRHWMYKDMIDQGAKAVIVSDGFWYVEHNDIDQRELRTDLSKEGVLPVVQINTKDLMMMLSEGAREVELDVFMKDQPGVSCNVVSTIPGVKEETIVFTAHYDSTSLSKGSWDNGTGSVALLKLMEYFKDHQPLRTLTFILTGSEERGLLGSKAYVRDHEAELDRIVLDINVDMIGGILSPLKAYVTAEEKFRCFIEYDSMIWGMPMTVFRDIASTDSTPFADKGVPAVAFTSFSPATPFHCRYDEMAVISKEELHKEIEYILSFSISMANAAYMPVKREIEADLKEKLDVYLQRIRK